MVFRLLLLYNESHLPTAWAITPTIYTLLHLDLGLNPIAPTNKIFALPLSLLCNLQWHL